jgi:hypothetical protein
MNHQPRIRNIDLHHNLRESRCRIIWAFVPRKLGAPVTTKLGNNSLGNNSRLSGLSVHRSAFIASPPSPPFSPVQLKNMYLFTLTTDQFLGVFAVHFPIPFDSKTMRFPREIRTSPQFRTEWFIVPTKNPLFSSPKCPQTCPPPQKIFTSLYSPIRHSLLVPIGRSALSVRRWTFKGGYSRPAFPPPSQ